MLKPTYMVAVNAHQYAVEYKHEPSLPEFKQTVKEWTKSRQVNQYYKKPRMLKMPNRLTLNRSAYYQ